MFSFDFPCVTFNNNVRSQGNQLYISLIVLIRVLPSDMYVYILYFRIFCMLFVFFFFILLICRLAVGLFFYNPRVVLYAKFIFAFFLLLLFLLRIHVRRSLHMFIIFYTFRSEGFEFWLSPPRLIAVVVALFD